MKINIKQYINTFGWKIFCMKAIRSKFYNSSSKLGVKICLLNEKIIKRFLQKNIINEMEEYKNKGNLFVNNNVPKNSIIWTMWWQGLNNAPDIVKACINNLKKCNPTRNIIVITKDNYQDYVHLNPEIINNLNNAKISVTHFSDIYRTNLLYIYGGIWIDSTVWNTKMINNSVFEKDFFTIKTGKYTNDPSHGRWTTFCLEAKAGNNLINFVRLAFDTYCMKYGLFMDYILFDYFIAIAVDISKENKQIINMVPVNNSKVFELEKYLNQSEKVYENFVNSNTYLYKLTYKKRYNEKSTKKRPTIYSKIIRER